MSGVNPSREEFDELLAIVRSGASLGAFESRTDYMSFWAATQLTNQELGLISQYVNGL